MVITFCTILNHELYNQSLSLRKHWEVCPYKMFSLLCSTATAYSIDFGVVAAWKSETSLPAARKGVGVQWVACFSSLPTDTPTNPEESSLAYDPLLASHLRTLPVSVSLQAAGSAASNRSHFAALASVLLEYPVAGGIRLGVCTWWLCGWTGPSPIISGLLWFLEMMDLLILGERGEGVQY